MQITNKLKKLLEDKGDHFIEIKHDIHYNI